MENKVYEEDFVKSHVSRDVDTIVYVLNQIRETYSKDKGWTVSDPEIILNADGETVTLKVHLKKEYKTEQSFFR